MPEETAPIVINPVDQTTVQTITAYKIGRIVVNLYKGATINVQLLDEKKILLKFNN